ncbi:hypothetical protein Huta_1066 [Halorhabdus utahensis DSM 12940]|uniref:Glycosyltransferase RgtA/B/C/D-like domain-containing protein n=1 Tax=Halorhabdus utahensis (strain DSM 12940 / JCM 11049 / AX-2) TaxID=519442 RepID=C7NM41_HALUD|nr:hypothetical protein [Halorhabdus utahensis]ACV11249.1 hypothetical protein Huta_1066 [Halorhabdus utahensis DSM 12940]
MRARRVAILFSILTVWVVTALVIGLKLSPIDGYKLSPYSFWLLPLLGFGLIASSIATIFAPKSPARWLLPAFPLVIVALPILRGYFYFGEGDPLYHLGAVRQLVEGSLPAEAEFYPALHYLATITLEVTGLEARQSLLLVMVVAFALWILAVPLLARAVTGTKLYLGVIAAAALLPITPISTFPRPHPATAAIFLTPVILLPAFLPKISRKQRSVVYVTLFLAAILYHPFVALVTVGMMFVWTNWGIGDSPSALRPALLVGSIIAVLAWLLHFSQFQGALVSSIIGILQGSVGADTASRVGSLQILGLSLVEYVARVGGKYLIFGTLSIIAVIASLRRRNWKLVIFTLGSVPAILGVILFFSTGSIGLWTRIFGLFMLIGTILAAVGASEVGELFGSENSRIRHTVSALVLVLAVGLALPTILPAPYTLQANDQVMESTYSGYHTSFEYGDDSTPWYEIRSPVRRYHSAIYGPDQTTGMELASGQGRYSRVPDHFNNRSLDEIEAGYLATTSADYERDVNLFDGFRYNETDFEYLSSSPCVNKLIDTGGFSLYRIC